MAALADMDEKADRLAVVDTVVIDEVLKAPFAVGQLAQPGARQSLSIVDQLPQQCGRLLRPVLGDNLGEAPFRNVAGGKLGAQVPEYLHRKAHVALDEGHDGLVEPASLVELHWGDAQSLGIYFGRIRCIRSRDAAADVGVVTDRAGEGEPLAPLKQRL